MAARWADHDLPLSQNVRTVRSPRANLNVNSDPPLGINGLGGDGWGLGCIPGWRRLFKGLAASAKTLRSASCLFNRAGLIWVCLGQLLSSLGRLSTSVNVRHSAFRSRTLWRGHDADLWVRASSVRPLGQSRLLLHRVLQPTVFYAPVCRCSLSVRLNWNTRWAFKRCKDSSYVGAVCPWIWSKNSRNHKISEE